MLIPALHLMNALASACGHQTSKWLSTDSPVAADESSWGATAGPGRIRD